MTSLTQIAYSGVRASQIALSSTGQNIANVNTKGFSRLQTQTASLANNTGIGKGGGVEVNSIRRLSDNFLNQQLWRAGSVRGEHHITQQYLGALEGVMVSEGASISRGLDQFFAALSEATTNPSSIALRQQFLNEAGNLAQRFNGLNSNINAQLTALGEQRVAIVTEINGYVANLAALNQQIVEVDSVKGDSTALRDQRDSLIQELSAQVSVRVQEAQDGSVSISLPNGQPLVSGRSFGSLSIETDIAGQQSLSLNFVDTRFSLKQSELGGNLGGLYEVEHGSLRHAQSSIQQLAEGLSQQFAQASANSFDLNGQPGQPLFVYSPGNINQLLTVNNITAEQVAFSDHADEVGNNQALLKMLDLRNANVNIQGVNMPIHDVYASLLGGIASLSRQSQADYDASTALLSQAQAQRDALSAVSLDEEAVNLMTYQQAYQANMKVISTANQIFDDMLAAF